MGLLTSLFSRSGPVEGAAPEADPADTLTQARTRARQRLIGAVVLVGIGIVGFPLLFETQPRPIPVNVPIEIPRKDNSPALNLPMARAPASNSNGNSAAPSTEPKPKPAPAPAPSRKESAAAIITETAAEAGLTTPPSAKPDQAAQAKPKAEVRPEPKAEAKPEPKPEAKPLAKVEPKPEPKAAAKPEAKPEPKPEAKPEPKPEPKIAAKPAAGGTDSARAQALLEGKAGTSSASAPAPATRFIVQIGAFADPVQARETRLKVERLGLTTYTHVAETPQGSRTRVRVGPMPSRQEAEKVAARLKAAGLPSAILTL